VCDFHYKSSALALNFSILLYILYNREPLGIFSHVPRLRGDSHGSLKNPIEYGDPTKQER